MAKNYLAMETPRSGDRLDYGVKGMKWGVRRSSSQLKAAAAKSGGSEKPAQSKPSGGSESAQTRYARLAYEAKNGQGGAMSDDDLKFFNARTDALAKVNKLNETSPGWLKTTTKSVLQNTAQKQMQSIADGIASKYISDPVLAALREQAKK